MVFGFRNVVFISCRPIIWGGLHGLFPIKKCVVIARVAVCIKNRTYDLRISYVRFFNIVRSVYMQPYVRFGKIERIILSNRTIDFFEREAKKTSTTECRRFFKRWLTCKSTTGVGIITVIGVSSTVPVWIVSAFVLAIRFFGTHFLVDFPLVIYNLVNTCQFPFSIVYLHSKR